VGRSTAAPHLFIGRVMFELATGRPPFIGNSPVDVMCHHLRANRIPAARAEPEASACVTAAFSLRCLDEMRRARGSTLADLGRAHCVVAKTVSPIPTAGGERKTFDPAIEAPFSCSSRALYLRPQPACVDDDCEDRLGVRAALRVLES